MKMLFHEFLLFIWNQMDGTAFSKSDAVRWGRDSAAHSCDFERKKHIGRITFPFSWKTREALIKSARADGEGFWLSRKYQTPGILCVFLGFGTARMGQKTRRSAADDLFRASLGQQ